MIEKKYNKANNGSNSVRSNNSELALANDITKKRKLAGTIQSCITYEQSS